MINKHEIIYKLYPSVVTIRGDEAFDANNNSVALDSTVIQTEIDKWQVEYNSQEYARKRRAEYPPHEDYLDGIVKGDKAQITKYIDDCQAVKLKYPKEAS